MDLDQLKRNWNEFGRRDPLWSILQWTDKAGGRWQAEEFFKIGIDEVNQVMTYLASLNITVASRRALDFGCGVGRLTQALCGHFEQVAGVDIAKSMIKSAVKYNRFGGRCRYYVNEADDLRIFPDNHFDFIYSNIVLQHMEPRYSKGYLKEFLRILSPAGVLVFQLPAAEVPHSSSPAPTPKEVQRRSIYRTVRSTVRGVIDYITGRGFEPRQEMHTIARDEVVALLEENGAEVVDVIENDASGAGFVSLRYCAVKPAPLGFRS